MSTSKKMVLILGFVWCGLCALFPPRQYIGGVHDARTIPTHEFLFSPDFQKFYFQQGLGNYYSVDVNGGRLLAELVLIVVFTGAAFLSVDFLVRGLQGKPFGEPLEQTTSGAGGSASAPTECVSCGTTIPGGTSTCPKCGWSYEIKPDVNRKS